MSTPICLNTLLDDQLYRQLLIKLCDEADLSYDFFRSLSEVIEEEPDEFTVKSIERAVFGHGYSITDLINDCFVCYCAKLADQMNCANCQRREVAA